MRARLSGAAVLLAGILTASPAAAQLHDGRARLYRLEPGSTFERGCFPPCQCPSLGAAPLAGTFRLGLEAVGDVFDFYEVSRVRWKVLRPYADAIPITGAGRYQVSTVAGLQQMVLDLTVDSDPPERYDSGEVGLEVEFPRIDVTVSIHGGYCFDTVLDLRARPTMRIHADAAELSWEEEPPDAAPWEVVAGDLAILRASGGDFAAASTACLVRDYWGTALPHDADPEPGQGIWFLARRFDGTFADGGPEQVGDPDAGIASSSAACR
jgi:hypothetical protein